MRFLQYEEFTLSLRDLYQKGGKYQKAAQTVQGIWGRAKLDSATLEETFRGVALTNHGESRIPHCVKYDLTGFARLVVVVNNNVCLFLFAGDHTAADSWIERNKGLDFVAKQQGDVLVLDKVRVSNATQGAAGRIGGESDLSAGPLMELLSERYRSRILHDLEEDALAEVAKVESVADDDFIFAVCTQCGPQEQQTALMDVLLSLRAGDVTNAKSRIDLYANMAKPVQELPPAAVESLQSSDAAVLLSDIDPELFQHFVQTASFEKWMLYLHPSQRQHVDRDFKGPARMAGVSGSGKTCVVVHRALRLADMYAPEAVLVVTLSAALASLINQLIDAQRGSTRPANLKVTSIFDLCFDKLMELEPHRRDYYTKRSIAKNAHAVPDHVDDVWHEFFLCENNNNDADSLFDLAQSLNARGIYANDYLRQECDYVRSSYAPRERSDYLKMDRQGRIVPLDERFRQHMLEGLAGWERKMNAVGVIDDMGIVAALFQHLDSLKPEYRSILVDEAQDLGTLELAVVRRLARDGENDLFLCGDAAQTIYTKSADTKAAGIDTTGRAVRLNQNYRNSRQILTAAHEVLTRALDSMPKGAMNLEVLAPEFASFSSPKPLMLRAASFLEELERGLGYLRACVEDGPTNQRFCLAICGYSQAAIEQLGAQLSLPILAANADVRTGRIFISDLEQTKGFEFDAVVVVNCSAGVLPHPNLPKEESFRDLCRLYVAMTRAKTQLVVSYTDAPSPFIEAAQACFVEAPFEEYAERVDTGGIRLPDQSIPKLLDAEAWGRPGKAFLKSRDAVGLDRVVQEEIVSHVTGIERMRGRERKQLEWKRFGSFAKAMEDPRARHQIVSEEAWATLSAHLAQLRGADSRS
jgi:superfamily I DNA/RNA helicase